MFIRRVTAVNNVDKRHISYYLSSSCTNIYHKTYCNVIVCSQPTCNLKLFKPRPLIMSWNDVSYYKYHIMCHYNIQRL